MSIIKNVQRLSEAKKDDLATTPLVQSTKVAFATVYAFYVKVQAYHWNVEGLEFFNHHMMFQKIYEDVYDSIDPLAEHIRTLGATAPSGMSSIVRLSTVNDEDTVPSAKQMVKVLLEDSEKVIAALNDTMAHAEKENKQGLMNFIAARIEAHNKWAWFLRATSKE